MHWLLRLANNTAPSGHLGGRHYGPLAALRAARFDIDSNGH